MKYKLIFIFCFFSFFKAQAALDINKNCQKALLFCFEFRFVEAQKLIGEELKVNPQNAYTAYLSNYIDCINLILDESELDYKRLKNNKKKNLTFITENCPKNSPYYRFLQAEINLQWAFARVKHEDYVSAALEINKAYNLLSENEKLYPEFYLNKKSMGLLHALIGTIPEDYQWLTSTLGFKGTIKQGLNELKATYMACQLDSNNKAYAHEIILYRTFVEGNLQNNRVDFLPLQNELNTLSKTPLIAFCMASLHIKSGNNDAAIKILQSTNFNSKHKHFYYLDYLLGDCKLKRLDADADKYLLRYVNNFKGKNYIKAAYLRLWWHYLLFNNKTQANNALQNLLKNGNLIADEDKQAVNETKQNALPSLSLLKARLLFDGGYYEKALEKLQQTSKTELINKNFYLEYVYRIARIFDKQLKTEKAKQFYELTLQKGEKEPLYFAASAALHLGNIYEKEGNEAKALYYYKKCQSFKNHAYKNSLSQKAKAGINRINS